MEAGLLIELVNIVVRPQIFFHCGLHAGGHEEILLAQAQFLACHMVVVRIKDFRQGVRQIFLLHRLVIVALVEGIEGKIIDRLGIPDPEGIDHIVAVSHDRKVIGNRAYSLAALLMVIISAGRLIIIHGHIAAEFDLLGVFRPLQFERIAAVREPVIRLFHLITVADLLTEHAIVITDAAPVRRITQRGQGIHEAGSQSSETAVSKSRIALLILDGIDVDTHLGERVFYLAVGAECQQVIAEVASREELHRHIVHDLRIVFFHLLLRGHPVVDDHVLYHVADSLVDLVLCCVFQCGTEKSADFIPNFFLKRLFLKQRIHHKLSLPFFRRQVSRPQN